jgi:Na+/H+ antiporter NhaB
MTTPSSPLMKREPFLVASYSKLEVSSDETSIQIVPSAQDSQLPRDSSFQGDERVRKSSSFEDFDVEKAKGSESEHSSLEKEYSFIIPPGSVHVPPPGWILLQNFLGGSPLWYKFGVIGCLLVNPLFMMVIGKFWTGWLITVEFIFTLVMALHCYPLQPGGLLVIEAVLMGMVSASSVYHHLESNLPVLLLVIFMVAGIHFMREFLMHFFTKLLLAVPNKTAISLVFLMATALFSAWLDALTVTAVLMNACFGFYAIYHRVAAEESRYQVPASLPGTPSKGSLNSSSAEPIPESPVRCYNSVPESPVRTYNPVIDTPQKLKTPHKEKEIQIVHHQHFPNDHQQQQHGSHGKEEAHTNNEQFDDNLLSEQHRQTLEEFRLFLRSLLMHAVVGTAIGGAFTIVGEPQNLLIGEKAGWNFQEYFVRCAPITICTAIVGVITCFALETSGPVGRYFGYGYKMPKEVKRVLENYAAEENAQGARYNLKAMIAVQVLVGIMLIVCLGTHAAAVGLIGLTVIILLTSFNGVVDEHRLGQSFTEAMPFTALLVVFFAVAGIIEENHLFDDMVTYIIGLSGQSQMISLYWMDGILSMVSDNVFVATLYINSFTRAFLSERITKSQFNLIAVAINVSTNIPSIATPNGQAAFLFLYTSKLAPLVKLSYFRMMWMALPYTIFLSLIAFLMTTQLSVITAWMVDLGWLQSM